MIVNQVNEGWELIFQRAHEMLATQIAYHWQQTERPERWIEFLAAISEHDNRQEGWHGSYHLSKAGAPLDFSLQDFSLHQARAITDVAGYKSRYVALLISMHTSFLYERLRGKNKETDQFLDDQQQLQQKHRKSLALSKSQADNAYALFYWADRCSLILCKNELPADERRLEVFRGPSGTAHYIWQRSSNGSLTVEPWPFEESGFTVCVESRVLPQLRFSTDQELANALFAAEVKEKKWVFKK